MKDLHLPLLISLTLMGCASTELVSNSKDTVIVKASLKRPGEAQEIADYECSKYNKSAHLNQFVPANSVYANYFFSCR